MTQEPDNLASLPSLGGALSRERAKAILDERARQLARVPAANTSAADQMEVTVFRLASETYAMETVYIRTVIRPPTIARVPDVPPFLLGVINLRGEVLGVVDLRSLLRVEQPVITEKSRILILGDERPEFGVLVDAVDEVTNLHIDQILKPPGSLSSVGRDYIRGVTSNALIVIDGGLLLRDERLCIDQSRDDASFHSGR